MEIDEAKFSRAIALARGAAGARVTAYNRATAMDAVNHAIDVFQALRMEIAGYGEPARIENGSGQPFGADKASSLTPAHSHCNGDGVGHNQSAGKAKSRPPAPSLPENYSGAGHSLAAQEANRPPPVPAVVPSVAQRAANIASRLQTADTILDSWKIGGIALGDIRYADLVRLRSDHIRGAAESIRVAGVLDIIHKRSGIPHDKGMPVRDLVSASDVEAMLDEVNSVTAAVLRPVVREMRRQTFKLRSPA